MTKYQNGIRNSEVKTKISYSKNLVNSNLICDQRKHPSFRETNKKKKTEGKKRERTTK